MAKIERGSLVEVKSGGPTMTAGSTENGYVECVWFEGMNVKRATFHEEQLDVSED